MSGMHSRKTKNEQTKKTKKLKALIIHCEGHDHNRI